ncbi:hypothetical protein BGZ59_009341, partial [Podila verticillata]
MVHDAEISPHRVQMQRDSSMYLYVESFNRRHSEPNDHYIELTAENYQAALTQDWLRSVRLLVIMWIKADEV